MNLDFQNACKCGDFSLAQNLWMSAETHDSFLNDTLFIIACNQNNVQLAEWLWDKSVEVNTPFDINRVFQETCQLGFLPIVEWLWDKSIELGTLFDVHFEHSIIFTFEEKIVLYFLKKGYYPLGNFSTPLLTIWKSGNHPVQIARKKFSPLLVKNIVKYI